MSGTSGNRSVRGRASPFSNFQSLHRALSPSAQAAASAGNAPALSVALAAATTVEEVINVVPVRYRDAVAPCLRTLADDVERAHSTRKQASALSDAIISGSYPKWVEGAIGLPSFQPMSGFANSPDGQTRIEQYRELSKTNLKKYREDWATETRSVLSAQAKYFTTRCSNTFAEKAFCDAVERCTDELVHSFPHMRTEQETDEQGDVVRDDDGNPLTREVGDFDATRARYQSGHTMVTSLALNIVESVRTIVSSRHARQATKDKKKAALKQQAEDVVMTAADDAAPVASSSTGPGFDAAALRRIIREEVAQATTVSYPAHDQIETLINLWVAEIEAPQTEGRGEPAFWTGEEEEENGEDRYPTSRASRARWWERQRAWARTCMTDRTWTYLDPCTYPDEILCCIVPLALKIIAWRAPLAVQEALRFRHPVHVQDGLLPPIDIIRDLGVGMRYIMPITVKNSLPLDAWNDFERRFKWFFHLTINPIVNKGSIEYTPEFESGKPSTRAPPRLPFAIQSALDKGRTLVSEWNPVEPSKTEDWAHRLAPDFRRRIEEWTMRHEAIVTQTDKNLGLAVVKKSWYISATRNLLLVERDYRPIELGEALRKIEYCVMLYREQMMSWESETSLRHNTQLCNFLWEGIEPFLTRSREPRPIGPVVERFEEDCFAAGIRPALLPGTDLGQGLDLYRRATPQFYGLPKIHKDPWKMRPIFPCHSAAIAHPARVLSKLLKLILAQRPYVLEGTKAFCVDLQKVDLNRFELADQKYHLITGDIVAYYPNVPVHDAAEIIRDMWIWFCSEHDVPLVYRELFNGLLTLNTELPSVCQFMEEYFEQRRGLAMGMHCAPDNPMASYRRHR